MSSLKVNMVIPKNTTDIGNFGWAESVVLESSAWGDGQHVASAALATRPVDALSDGKGPRAVIWGHYVEVNDRTNQPVNVSGSLVTAEWDMYANGTASIPGGAMRIGHHQVFSRMIPTGEKMRAAYGSVLGSNDGFLGYAQADRSLVGSGYAVTLPWDKAAFDASEGLGLHGAPGLKLAQGQSIAFDGSTAGFNRILKYVAGQLLYQTQNGTVLIVDDAGNLTTAGAAKVLLINLGESTAPSSSTDPSGSLGDIRKNGATLYMKTTAGWVRFVGQAF